MAEFEFMSSAKFEILSRISLEESSPTEIASKLGFSVPYIHQQLVLLEAQGYVKKRVSRKGVAGKPKQKYHLAVDVIDISILKDGFSKRVRFSKEEGMSLYFQIVSSLPQNTHELFSKFYWQNLEYIKKLTSLSLISYDDEKLELFGITDSGNVDSLRKNISHFKCVLDGEKIVVCWVNTLDECEHGLKVRDSYYLSHITRAKPLFDKEKLFQRFKELI